MHHINWWAVALFVSVAANNAGQYMPPPGTFPGFISSPWYPMLYHGVRGVLSANPIKSMRTVQNEKDLNGPSTPTPSGS